MVAHAGELDPPLGLDPPVGGRAQVVEVGGDRCIGGRESGVVELGLDAIGEREEVLGVPFAGGFGFTRVGEALRAVLAQGLQKPVTAVVGFEHHE